MSAVSLHPFETLTPQRVVEAVESLGFWLPGEPFALNSYENRVYSLTDDDRRRWVVKFYRPERWSDEQILEEHEFLQALAAESISVGAPWADDTGRTLHHFEGFRFALFAVSRSRAFFSASERTPSPSLSALGCRFRACRLRAASSASEMAPSLLVSACGNSSRICFLIASFAFTVDDPISNTIAKQAAFRAKVFFMN